MLNKKLYFIIIFLYLVGAAFPSYSAEQKKTLILSQKSILKKVLSSSPFIKKTALSRKINASRLLEAKYSFYTQELFSNWMRGKRKNPQIFIFESKEQESSNFHLGIKQNMPYGLSFHSSYSKFNERKKLSDFLTRAKSPDQTYRSSLSLELEANLTQALSQHWALQSIKKNQTLTDWLYFEQAETLALKALRQYWKSYLAWNSYIQTKQGLNAYLKLVRQIKSKQKYNFLTPGETPQVLAEFENIKQSHDEQKQNYEDEQKALLLFLNKNPKKYKIQFKEPQLSPPPRFQKINPESTRVIKIKKSQLEAQRFKWKETASRLIPGLSFKAKGGLIPAAVKEEDLSFSAKHSFYELGFSLKWVLFSKSAYEKANQEQYKWEESKIDLAIFKQELQNQIDALKESIAIQWTGIQRAKKSNRYQKTAFRELIRSFEQGRVDVFELINTENKLRASELQKAKAISLYSLSLLQLAALKDQLVEPYLKP